MRRLACVLVLALALVAASPVSGQVDPVHTMKTVAIRDAGNAKDPQTGFGSVTYDYKIGKYDVTIEQYAAFLNAKADIPPNDVIRDLWSEDMDDPNEKPGKLIARTGNGVAGDPHVYTVEISPHWGAESGRRPICWVNWFAAARFANWLHNGALRTSDTESGAYTLVKFKNAGIVRRNADARWWIPSEDEWYKAAYYDPTRKGVGGYYLYPTRSDTVPHMGAPPGLQNSANFNNFFNTKGNVLTPVGAYTDSASHYGTFDQGGNLWQWTDGVYSTNRIIRGGSFSYGLTPPRKTVRRDYEPGFYKDDDTGFRLAGAP